MRPGHHHDRHRGQQPEHGPRQRERDPAITTAIALPRRCSGARRLLRYYEEQGLPVSSRSPNGYRDHDEYSVDRVLQIRGLLDAGLPTRIIKRILPCLDKPRLVYFPDATPEMLATLEHERDRMTDHVRCPTRNRDAIADYLDAVREYDRQDTSAS